MPVLRASVGMFDIVQGNRLRPIEQGYQFTGIAIIVATASPYVKVTYNADVQALASSIWRP